MASISTLQKRKLRLGRITACTQSSACDLPTKHWFSALGPSVPGLALLSQSPLIEPGTCPTLLASKVSFVSSRVASNALPYQVPGSQSSSVEVPCGYESITRSYERTAVSSKLYAREFTRAIKTWSLGESSPSAGQSRHLLPSPLHLFFHLLPPSQNHLIYSYPLCPLEPLRTVQGHSRFSPAEPGSYSHIQHCGQRLPGRRQAWRWVSH